ncbi:MAG: HNH endonuclease signature motif containing protein [Chloroflexota bacterium]
MPRSYIPVGIKRIVKERAYGCCEYCFAPEDHATETFEIEHIIPLSKGGTSEPNNLALSCSGCNSRKYNRTEALDPINDEMVALYNPRLHNWVEHYSWSPDYTLLIAHTSIARATINALGTNRTQLVNMRLLLYSAGKHPPKFMDGYSRHKI